MISSKEILSTEGISRATLNNYIKRGILPPPIVRKTGGGKGGPQQMGYFPPEVVDLLKNVKAMKSEGYSLEMIAAKLKSVTGSGTFEARGPLDSKSEKRRSESLPLFFNLTKEVVSGDLRKKRKSPPAPIKNGKSPALLSVCVLVSILDDWERFRMERLPEDYFGWIKRVCTGVSDAVRMNHGIVVDSREGILAALFSCDGNPDYIRTALKTALEMRKRIEMINQDLLSGPGSRRQGPHLNTGISIGEEYIEIMEGSISGVLTSPGFVFSDATALARFARNGSIWVTKDVFCRLVPEDRTVFRYGVSRSGVFEESTFARLRDMAIEGLDDAPCPLDVHDRLIVAELLTETF